MSSPFVVATPAEIRARLAFKKSERERLRAEEDAALEREAEEELARAEAARFQAAEAARRQEEGRQQLARLQAEFGSGMQLQTKAEGKQKATVIDVVEDESEAESDAVRFLVFYLFLESLLLLLICSILIG